MSKLIDEITFTISYNRFPRKIRMGIVNAEVSLPQPSVQEINEEIIIEAKIFVVAKSMVKDRQRSLHNASEAIRHVLYKDVIELGREIADAAYEGDCEKVVLLTKALVEELTGINNEQT